MSDLIEKLSSYNLFNYLLPGTVFVYLVEALTTFRLVHENVFVAAFAFYFIGLFISRVGSIFIEPLLRRIAPHMPYEDYVAASKADNVVNILSEQNNVYRTLIATATCVLLTFVVDVMTSRIPTLKDWLPYIALSITLVLFVLAYRKQTLYVVKRIQIHKNSDTK